MSNFLDDNGVLYLWSKVKGLFNQGVKSLTISGTTITYTKGDGSTGTIEVPQKTYNAFQGATANAAGSSGLVPAPSAGKNGKYLRGDGTWETPTNTTYNAFGGATASAAGSKGLVPAPSAGKQGSFLKGDGTWGTPTNTTYNAFGGATESAGGLSGLVPAPSAGLPKVLLNNGAWEKLIIDIQDAAGGKDKIVSLSTASNINYDQITIPCFSASTSGLVPKSGENDKSLFGDGTWGLAVGDVSTTYGAEGFAINMLVNNGTEYKIINIPNASDTVTGLLSANMHKKLNELPTVDELLTLDVVDATYAKKTDITNVYKYKGSVASASALPTTGQKKGDVYNIEAASQYGGAGMNVAWDGAKWDPLGEIFSITAITNAQLDAICV